MTGAEKIQRLQLSSLSTMLEQRQAIEDFPRGPDEFITVGTTKFDAFVVENNGCVGGVWNKP
jgi:hypothetical protein